MSRSVRSQPSPGTVQYAAICSTTTSVRGIAWYIAAYYTDEAVRLYVPCRSSSIARADICSAPTSPPLRSATDREAVEKIGDPGAHQRNGLQLIQVLLQMRRSGVPLLGNLVRRSLDAARGPGAWRCRGPHRRLGVPRTQHSRFRGSRGVSSRPCSTLGLMLPTRALQRSVLARVLRKSGRLDRRRDGPVHLLRAESWCSGIHGARRWQVERLRRRIELWRGRCLESLVPGRECGWRAAHLIVGRGGWA